MTSPHFAAKNAIAEYSELTADTLRTFYVSGTELIISRGRFFLARDSEVRLFLISGAAALGVPPRSVSRTPGASGGAGDCCASLMLFLLVLDENTAYEAQCLSLLGPRWQGVVLPLGPFTVSFDCGLETLVHLFRRLPLRVWVLWSPANRFAVLPHCFLALCIVQESLCL